MAVSTALPLKATRPYSRS